MTEPARELPHNIEAEQALLGAIFVNNEAWFRVDEFLEPDHFYDPLHGRIYEHLAAVIRSGKRATPITLKTFFEDEAPIGSLTVPQYLGRLAANATTLVNAADYGRTILDLSVRRSLIEVGAHLVATATNCPVDTSPLRIVEDTEAELYRIGEKPKGQGMRHAALVLSEAIDRADEAHRNEGVGISTGLPSLDDLIGPLMPGDLIVLGGATSMGKTALGQGIGRSVAEAGYHSAGVSLEMTPTEYMNRYIAQESGVAAERIERGSFDHGEFARLSEAKDTLSALPLYVDGGPRLTMEQIRTRLRRLKRESGLDFCLIDHSLFIRHPNPRLSREERISENVAECKAVAKELEIPILLLSHLNRNIYSRDIADRRPTMSDLFGAGAIERDADVVFFVHRQEYWLDRAGKPDEIDAQVKWQQEKSRHAGKAELILEKRRRGRGSGSCILNFNPALTRFTDRSTEGNLI